MSSLFIVGTPIGNLEDITYRAIKILSSVDMIAAEDTRHTKILLDKYLINKPMSSYHKFNIKAKTNYFVEILKAGKNIALVSDAGMPAISDPGYELVKAALDNGISVVPIPGPSAMITALSVSGLPTDKFMFLGFLPKKRGKIVKVFKELNSFSGTIIIYESPYRLIKTLKVIKEIFGERKVVVARELTKKFEEVLRGNISDALNNLEMRKIKGEMTLLIEGRSE